MIRKRDQFNTYGAYRQQFEAALDADQAEGQAIRIGHTICEVGIDDERISGQFDDMLAGESDGSWQKRGDILEERNGAVVDEIRRRCELMGAFYPFELDGNALSYKKSRTGVYEVCLAAARHPTGAVSGQHSLAAMFEWVSRDVLRFFLGVQASCIRTGWPSFPCEGRPTSLKDACKAINAETREFEWRPEGDLPENPSVKYLKDAGLDVVAWKYWPDEREALFFAVGQCGCGKLDVSEEKARQLQLVNLKRWLHPVTHVEPVRCLFLAHHVPNRDQLCVLSKNGGLVFDRMRIAMLAEGCDEFGSREGFDYSKEALYYLEKFGF